ncbi:transmembrane protein 26-like [Mercenaria mercenaria]|uniref:transmembrane protein 26-like n=1 Tax=Mercenaria mercenaria TaxID=6596 RepID=UPI00234E8570|nr:transmembrane protein 26-like [Mercenaria mercenaria]
MKPKKVTVNSLIFRSDLHKYRKIFRAIFTRLLLVAHCSIAIVLAGRIDSRYYGIFAPSIFLFLAEAGIILYFRWGCEWKRICTCFCVYLLTLVPVLWILRLHETEDPVHTNSTQTSNVTTTTTTETVETTAVLNSTGPISLRSTALQKLREVGVTSLMEQSMMFLIILCRWLLPRGRIDRNSLSQLLIMYSAISADTLDFSEIFNKGKIKHSGFFRYVVLGVWSWSLVQFIIVITTSFAIRRQERHAGSRSQDRSEILSVLMVLFMQDGPFLGARCYAIFYVHVFEYLIIFFSLKNMLTLVLGFYRLLVLCDCISTEGHDLLRKSEIARSMESLDDLDTDTFEPKKKGKNSKITRKKTRF